MGPRPLGRRRLLGLVAGAGLVTFAGCASTATGTSTAIPEETAGPYPADGSNGPNVLTASGVVRRDITSSFGALTGTAPGVPLTIALSVADLGGSALPGATVYLWHCDRDGRYSLYDVADRNYLRGVQQADRSGEVTFTSIFPAAYSGRWPHIHVEVYPDLASATAAGTPITTTQLALPEAVCDEVYATDGYSASVRNLSRTSLAGDMVFRDGYESQLATVTGSVSGGLTAALRVVVDA